MKFCTNCGNPINANAKFCTKCGNSIKSVDIKNQEADDFLKKVNDNINETIDFSKENSDNSMEKKVDTSRIDLGKQASDYEAESRINTNSKYSEYEDYKADRYDRNKGTEKINNESKKSQKSFLSGTAPKIIIAVVLIIAILAGVFFNTIRGEYYIMKANNAANVTEKFDYAVKAVKVLNRNDTKELLKSTLVDMAKSDVESAEDKLNQVSSILSQGDYQNIAVGIKDKKIDKLYKEGKYQEAAAEFSEIDKLGGDFKQNKNYDDIMLNVISKITNTPLANTKNLLMDDRKICFDNFDDDPFDEIIELKNDGKYSYNSGLKLNLYKMKNGQYKLVDTTTIDHVWDQNIQGVYNYAEKKNGLFVHYANASNNFGTGVFGVDNNKLQLKGQVFGNNSTKPDDVDNDGIYEVLSSSTSFVSSIKKDTSKWYKIYEDGRTPTEVNGNSGGKDKTDTTKSSSSDYIFKDSDKTYLMEDDLRNLSKDQLALARNEIFARHGYVFTTDEYKKYFSSKSWYVPNPNFDGSDSSLNEYEIANYKVLQQWENKK